MFQDEEWNASFKLFYSHPISWTNIPLSHKPYSASLPLEKPFYNVDVVYPPGKNLYKQKSLTSRILLIERGLAKIYTSEDLSAFSRDEIDKKFGTFLVSIFFDGRTNRLSNVYTKFLLWSEFAMYSLSQL